jgi:2-iminoacetate synthase
MNFFETYQKYGSFDIKEYFDNIKPADVKRAIYEDTSDPMRYLTLLSPVASNFLEMMAQEARDITTRNFGRTIQLYTPLYLSNFCDNQCVYCGFNQDNSIQRGKLNIEEVKREADYIAGTGLRHILILTGDSRGQTPVSYIKENVEALKSYFNSISIEIYALEENEYKDLIKSGIDGLTLYQEVYDEGIYASLHPAGPKSDYHFRLDAPQRACAAGIRMVNIGVLLGLNKWREEVFFMGLHAKYLQDMFPSVEVGVSLPRIRPHAGDFQPLQDVTDQDIVQCMVALRIFQPRIGITLSTRESDSFRENVLPLGVTRMSAGSTTVVGGHTAIDGSGSEQFEIADERNVIEMRHMLLSKGYQPVMNDWIGNK